jgi:hypothetical protein
MKEMIAVVYVVRMNKDPLVLLLDNMIDGLICEDSKLDY